jgi:hypothetical protein
MKMGIFADFIANSPFVTSESPRVGRGRVVHQELYRLQLKDDPDPTPGFAAQHEIQQVTQGIPSGAWFKLKLTSPTGVAYETAAMIATTGPAAIESSIDTACAAVPGWLNGDISVLGGSLWWPPVQLTYDGASVANQNWGDLICTMVSPITDNVTTATIQNGQPSRYAWAVMGNLGMIAEPPLYGSDMGLNPELRTAAESNPRWPSAALREVLALQAALDDNNNSVIYEQLRQLFNVE